MVNDCKLAGPVYCLPNENGWTPRPKGVSPDPRHDQPELPELLLSDNPRYCPVRTSGRWEPQPPDMLFEYPRSAQDSQEPCGPHGNRNVSHADNGSRTQEQQHTSEPGIPDMLPQIAVAGHGDPIVSSALLPSAISAAPLSPSLPAPTAAGVCRNLEQPGGACNGCFQSLLFDWPRLPDDDNGIGNDGNNTPIMVGWQLDCRLQTVPLTKTERLQEAAGRKLRNTCRAWLRVAMPTPTREPLIWTSSTIRVITGLAVRMESTRGHCHKANRARHPWIAQTSSGLLLVHLAL